MIAITDLFQYIANAPDGLNPAKHNEFVSTTVAHELTHLLFEKINAGAFNAIEHTTNANGTNPHLEDEDKTRIMFNGSTPGNCELALVRFFPVVQQELEVRRNQALVL